MTKLTPWLFLLLLVVGCRSPKPAAKQPKPKPKAIAGEMVCSRCHKEIEDRYFLFEKKHYHPDCYAEVAGRCGICQHVLSGVVAIVGPGPGYHESCFRSTVRCDACSLPVAGERGGGVALEDGRKHCKICHGSAVFKNEDAREVCDEAVAALRRVLGLDLSPWRFKLELTDRKSLARKAGTELLTVKGFTEAWRQDRVVNSKVFEGPWNITIWALKGLPREALLGVLAHELFHVWQLHMCPDQLDASFREGGANYVQWRIMKHREQTLWLALLENDSDPTYGDGFRRFRRWVDKATWPRRLQQLRKLRQFPSR